MNFFMIIGPQAVGKMTVGQSLADKIGAKLFYNHMTIDLVDSFFDYGSQQGNKLVKDYRNLLFEAVIETNDYPGFIFTYVCDFESKDGLKTIYDTCHLFEKGGHIAYIIELNADYETRRKRNVSENRRFYKKMKRDISKSIEVFERLEKNTRSISFENEIDWPRYLRIDNTLIEADTVTDKIIDFFNL